MTITAKTRITGLIGWPVEHSLSPFMHNAGFQHLGIDYCYLTFAVHPDNLGKAIDGVRAMNFCGVNVTVPHKEKVMAFLDDINEEARFIGAVNTIVNKDDKLIGYNTDGRGFIKSLEEADIHIAGKRVFIVGAGGASRAISYYLAQQVAELFIFDIDTNKLSVLINDLRRVSPQVYMAEGIEQVRGVDLVINATPLGLKPNDPLPIDITLLNEKQAVYDLVYKTTNLLTEATYKGCKALNGIGMLFWQGVHAFEIWTQGAAPVEVMKSALLSAMNNR
ncbi:MAG: shikimate dehydrogenase [Candidatus Magnetoovum sp. WYHC-5]|nr:shikimate dehydrogenase [Candidatus Magnetoovum sp. WYHC-5]